MSRMMNTAAPLLECRDVSKHYGEGALSVAVLKHLNVTLSEGDDLAITGASGSGKSTLVHLLGGVDAPDSGEITVRGRGIHRMSESERCRWRNQAVGFVYQFHHLLVEFTVLENVAMPLLIAGQRLSAVKGRVIALLEQAGLAARAAHKPHELSGGERQRVAICRAVIPQPQLILADEPTGNLDRETAQRVVDMMLEIKRQSHASLVVVTHDEALARRCGRVVRLEGGCLHESA